MKTTYNTIKSFDPCEDGWKRLLNYHKPVSLNEKIEFKDILKSNGVKDAIWALRTVNDKKSIILFCADVAESVLHIYEKQYPGDKRVRECIKACRQYADGKITKKELEVKKEAVVDAIYAIDNADIVDTVYDAAYAAEAAEAAAATAATYTVAAVATYKVAVAATTAEQQKWDEITNIFLKYF